MQNTIAKDTLREYVKENEVVLAKGDKVTLQGPMCFCYEGNIE